MEQIFSYLGPWTWVVIGIVLLILELLVSGVFLIWFGLAAIAVAALNAIFGLSWQMELTLFAILSAALLIIARPFIRKRLQQETDRPHLNRRLESYIGSRYVLEEPIINGRGKLRIEDTVWQIQGPDLETGKRIRITAADEMQLIVEPIED